jgi:hypothetical protein
LHDLPDELIQLVESYLADGLPHGELRIVCVCNT